MDTFNVKKVISGLLAVTMLAQAVPNIVYAAEINSDGGNSKVPTKVTAEAAQFSVSIPTKLPVDISADGTVTTSKDNKIVNKSSSPVEVSSIRLEVQNDWEIVDFDSEFSAYKLNEKKFGFKLQTNNVQPDGSCGLEGFSVIKGNSELPFTYDAHVATQISEINSETMANVIFTVGWSEGASEPSESAVNSTFDKDSFKSAVPNTATSVTFGTQGGSDPVPVSDDGNILVAKDEEDYYIYNKTGGKIVFPADCYMLFYEYKSLTKIDFGTNKIDTSNVTNMAGLFGGCKSLSELDLREFDTSNVTSMEALFGYCESLSELNLSGFDTSNVTNMSNMFLSCNFSTVDLSSFSTSKVTNMSGMFCSCDKLQKLDLNNFDTSQVTDMSTMFFENFELASLEIGDFNYSSCKNIDSMFFNCVALKSIDIHNIDISSLQYEDIINTFGGLSEGTSIVVGSEADKETMNSYFSSHNFNITVLESN